MPETQVRVQVRVRGRTEYFFEMTGPNPTVPRTGEYVEFADSVGKVVSVTWSPLPATPGLVLVVAECVPAPERHRLETSP